jgi:hypothetical protein
MPTRGAGVTPKAAVRRAGTRRLLFACAANSCDGIGWAAASGTPNRKSVTAAGGGGVLLVLLLLLFAAYHGQARARHQHHHMKPALLGKRMRRLDAFGAFLVAFISLLSRCYRPNRVPCHAGGSGLILRPLTWR